MTILLIAAVFMTGAYAFITNNTDTLETLGDTNE